MEQLSPKETRQTTTHTWTHRINIFPIIILIGGFAALLIANEMFFYKSPPTESTIEIAPGVGSRKIADLLKQNNIIRSKWTFELFITLTLHASDLKPGSYTFLNNTIPHIADTLIRGGMNEVAITIPEGWSIEDIRIYFEKEHIASSTIFTKTATTPITVALRDRFAFLQDAPQTASLDGYLFPDTYRIFKNSTADDIIDKMLENFDRKLDKKLREEIERQEKTIFEIITMASLIEKEVVSDEDRAIVSGILWKRLTAGVALQVDATVAYITGKNSTRISRDELSIDSPYNTYRYRGLPKGPIANPGLSAIRTALFPKKSPYWFYLSSRDGKTIFSKTLDEHNAAKAKYLR